MTISTGATIDVYGTPDTVSAAGGTSSVAAGAYAAAADTQVWTNDDDAPYAAFVLTFQYPSGTITQGGIQLACRMLNINGTTDEPPVSANWTGHALGSFPTGTGIAATTTVSIGLGPVELPRTKSSQEYEFYPVNNSGVVMSAGWTLTVIPTTDAPHP